MCVFLSGKKFHDFQKIPQKAYLPSNNYEHLNLVVTTVYHINMTTVHFK